MEDMIDLDDTRRAVGLKSNMLSDYTRIFDKAPLAYNQIINLVHGLWLWCRLSYRQLQKIG
jgi:hypothetical protein